MKSELKLLILEDEALDAELIKKFLQRWGLEFEAIIASDRDEFEKAIQKDSFDAILADNSLPQFSSIDALQFLRERNMDTPFILVTGTVSEEFAVEIIHKGADDYILKNNLARLPSAISRALEKGRAKREKLLTEAALRKSEEEYRLLFDVNPLAAYVVDDESKAFLAVNKAAVKLYGYSSIEFKGMRIDDLLTSSEEEAFDGRSSVTQHVKRDGTIIAAEIVSSPVSYENSAAHLVLVNDLTQKLKADAAIKQVNRELRDLASHLQNIREEERIQIARDIHDELGQQLAGLKMDLHTLNRKVNPEENAIKGKFTDVLTQVEELVKSVRKIASNLRPTLLDDFGLAAALKWQSQEVEARFEIKIQFTSDFPEMDIPPSISTGLFRIYQEALTNAVRHANAHLIESSLTLSDNRILLKIRDDGKGIDLHSGTRKKSFGLLGIKERVFVMNGNYELKSEPGKGTCLYISVPL